MRVLTPALGIPASIMEHASQPMDPASGAYVRPDIMEQSANISILVSPTRVIMEVCAVILQGIFSLASARMASKER